MKRKILLVTVVLTLFGISIPTLQSSSSGTPSDGRTGSPGDGGKTCATAGCHNGTAQEVSGILSSNVPAEGYTPGETYSITVTVDQGGNKGFIVSPQKEDGTLLGSLTAGAGNQRVGGKYITHTSPIATSTAVWNFTWTAPAAGTGNVDFYGAFANNRTLVRKTKLTVSEKVASGINSNASITGLRMYPNPNISQDLSLSFELKKSVNLKIELIDITGKSALELFTGVENSGNFNQKFKIPSLTSGLYFLRVQAGEDVLTRKLLIQQ
jgi:hypothetical protein